MAGPFDFTGQNIENTYQRVLQTPDGVNIYDGTGSLFTVTAVAAPAGPNQSIQFNDAGTTSGSGNFIFDKLTNNVTLTGSILLTDSVYFSGSGAASRLTWNNTDGTLDLGLKGGNVTLQIGQEEVVRVVNKTGINLTEAGYQAVRLDGAQGNRVKVALAKGDADGNSLDTLGLVTEDIAINQEGFVTTTGLVRGINTTGNLQGETWVDGDALYLSPSTAGGLTKFPPTAPSHSVRMGYVVQSNPSQGSIYVKVDNGYELDELHNVRINTASLSSGDLLVYSSSVWVNAKQLTGSYGLTGSLNATLGFTGSLFGTASWAINAITSSRPIAVTGSTIYSTAPATSNINTNNNIFLGGSSGLAATNASNAIFLGNSSGYQASNAAQSIFLGISAGRAALNAAQSNFIGVAAGMQASSASFSTFMGYYAGYNASSTGVGSNNIIIGTNITLPDRTKDSINLGGIIFATGSYSTITGDPYSGSQYGIGKVGINKVIPEYTLDVSGSSRITGDLIVTGIIDGGTF